MKTGHPCWKRFSSGEAPVDDMLLNKADIVERRLKRSLHLGIPFFTSLTPSPSPGGRGEQRLRE